MSSVAHAQRWDARHAAPLVWDPILCSKIRLALSHYSSDASRPSPLEPLGDHNVSGICLACEMCAYLGLLVFLRPAPQPWPPLLPSSSSPCPSSPSAADGAKCKLQFQPGKTRSQKIEIGAFDCHDAHHIGVSERLKERSNGQAGCLEPAGMPPNHRNRGPEVALSIHIRQGYSVDTIQKRMEYPEIGHTQSCRHLSPAELLLSHVQALRTIVSRSRCKEEE